MVLRNLAQVIVLGAQLVGRAFTKAFREELAASRAAAERYRNASASESSNTSSSSSWTASADSLQGITVQEAKQILNVNELKPELIAKNYEHLFAVNDKSKGGSLYIQSKVFRAKERLDYELSLLERDKEKSAQQSEQPAGESPKQTGEPPKKE